ncbi:MAG: hypothetical protein ACREBE_11030, partial [bacterium]
MSAMARSITLENIRARHPEYSEHDGRIEPQIIDRHPCDAPRIIDAPELFDPSHQHQHRQHAQ